MDLWIKISNVVTIGNIGTIVSMACFVIYSYYRVRRYLAQQHIEFLSYVKKLTEEQTSHLENCIHQMPNHPENPANPDSGTSPKVPPNLST